MFESNITLDESTIKELKIIAIPPKKNKFFIISSIVSSLLGILSFILWIVMSDIFYMAFGIFLEISAIILILGIYYIKKIFEKTNIKTIKELSKTNSLEIKTIFNENNIIINNLTTSAKIELKYDRFIKFYETTNLYVLVTGSNLQVYMPRKNLNNEEINSFKAFIKEKCKNIKW